MPTEIVRLRTEPGGQEALLSYLSDQAYFGQAGLRNHRILKDAAGEEVVLILDWETRQAGPAAIASPVGKAFADGLMPLLAGPPELSYYEPVPQP